MQEVYLRTEIRFGDRFISPNNSQSYFDLCRKSIIFELYGEKLGL
ncbi:hypothetical protein [Candidatus Tisiphia endosymbiont of Beris chalybata]